MNEEEFIKAWNHITSIVKWVFISELGIIIATDYEIEPNGLTLIMGLHVVAYRIPIDMVKKIW
jgi:hypothetical protein